MVKSHQTQKAPKFTQEVQVVWKLGLATKEKGMTKRKKQVLYIPAVLNGSDE